MTRRSTQRTLVIVIVLILALVAAGIAVVALPRSEDSSPTTSRQPGQIPILTSSSAGDPSRIALGADVSLGWTSTTAWAAHDLHQLASHGVHLVRQDFVWYTIEPEPGVFTWNRTDHLMAEAARNHIEVLPILDYTPGWANHGAGPRVPPDDLNKYASFAAAVVKRYGVHGSFWGQRFRQPTQPIRTIEIWNEPWYFASWTAPDPVVYAQMVRLASAAARAVNPGIHVAICTDPELEHGQGAPRVPWVEALARAFPDMATYADVGSVHIYASWATSPRVLPVVQIEAQLAVVDNALGSAKFTGPLWITEAGVSATDISQNVLHMPPKIISSKAWAIQRNAMTLTMDSFNALAEMYNVTRVYAFTFIRSDSASGFDVRDQVESGLLFEGPKGNVRGGGLAVFDWISDHPSPPTQAGTATR